MRLLKKQYLRSLLAVLLVMAAFSLSGCDMFDKEEEDGDNVLYV